MNKEILTRDKEHLGNPLSDTVAAPNAITSSLRPETGAIFRRASTRQFVAPRPTVGIADRIPRIPLVKIDSSGICFVGGRTPPVFVEMLTALTSSSFRQWHGSRVPSQILCLAEQIKFCDHVEAAISQVLT